MRRRAHYAGAHEGAQGARDGVPAYTWGRTGHGAGVTACTCGQDGARVDAKAIFSWCSVRS